MDTKAAFEKWVRRVMYDTDDLHEEFGMYANLNVRIRWEAWQASREAIEIEREPEHEWMGEYPSHDSFLDGYANGWNDCVDAITSHGIRIKGKTE